MKTRVKTEVKIYQDKLNALKDDPDITNLGITLTIPDFNKLIKKLKEEYDDGDSPLQRQAMWSSPANFSQNRYRTAQEEAGYRRNFDDNDFSLVLSRLGKWGKTRAQS